MKPYLSIVATSRNDNHGKDLLKRMEYFISGVIQQSNRYKIPVELIIVEWNPPKDKKKLPEVLHIGDTGEYCIVRNIEVSEELHLSFRRREHNLPLYQMIAKNVGIRRAKGDFILATNIDLLFSNELFEWFSKRELLPDMLYRANRYDIDNNLPENGTVDEWLKFAESHIVRKNTFYGSQMTESWLYASIHNDDTVPGQKIPNGGIAVYGNASGDFQLLHKSVWEKTRGYVEWDEFSFHMDSIFEYAGVLSVKKEVILPDEMCAYHIEHGEGYKFDDTESMNNKVKKESTGRILGSELRVWGELMAREKRAFIFNRDDWGLINYTLPETVYAREES